MGQAASNNNFPSGLDMIFTQNADKICENPLQITNRILQNADREQQTSLK